MALKYYDSPFHATHDSETASKMAMKMDLSIMLSKLIKEQNWTQKEAAERLGVQQSRVSDLKNAKIENSPLMQCSTCLMFLVFVLRCQCRLYMKPL